MSVSRTSGAIPQMTARQIATASFAVPKSVMKTIVGRGVEAGAAAGAACLGAGCEHPQNPTANKVVNAMSERIRTIISECDVYYSQVVVDQRVYMNPSRHRCESQKLVAKAQILMDDTLESSKLCA